MKVLTDSRRAAILALLTVLLGATALFLGGAVQATTTNQCNDDSTPPDLWVNVGTLAYAGVGTHNDGTYTGAYVCATPPGTAWFVGYEDKDSSTPGMVFYVDECPAPTYSCNNVVYRTGAEVEPDVDTNSPGGSTAGTGGSAGVGSGTCTWINSFTPNCPGGATIAGVTLQEGDLPTVTTTNTSPPPACTGVNNTCPGAYVVVGGDTSHDTIDTTVAGTPVKADIPRNCVQVNSICPT